MCADDYTTPIVLWAPALPDIALSLRRETNSQKLRVSVVAAHVHTRTYAQSLRLSSVVWRRRAGDANGRDETA